EELIDLQQRARRIHVDRSIKEYIVGLVQQSRRHPALLLGASPRAAASLMHAAQAKALVASREYVVPDDVKAMAVPVLAHRLILRSDAKAAGKDQTQVEEELLHVVPVPNFRPAAGERP